MPQTVEPVHIDLSQFKLHIRIGPRTEITLHFDSPSRRFYLSVIALVVHQMKNLGRITTIPLYAHIDHLALLNNTIGGAAGSTRGLIPRIYRKWKNALPDLEHAPLFKVAGRRREHEDGSGPVYRFTDAEKDAWANLFEYKGSEQNVRLRFSLDRLGTSLNDVAIVYEGYFDADAWERFIADLGKDASSSSLPIVSAPDNPLYRRVFVGREAELRQLQSTFERALAGEGALVMIAGEPGIGKTALCEQLMAHATVRGGRVLLGHTYEEGSLSLPYRAFMEALRSHVIESPPHVLCTELGLAAPDVSRIIPEVRDKLGIELPEKKSPAEERYRLFQGVTDFLCNIARSGPVLLVLEDLHNADQGTLEMLRHVCRSLAGKHLLIVGTYRDVEVDRKHPLSGALADLKRLQSSTRLLLKGLDVSEVRRMFAVIAKQEITPPLADAVHRQTEGNPLFVQEVIRYFVEQGITRAKDVELRIPDGLKDVIGKRLSSLSDTCNKLLSHAAVVGREFRHDVLERVTDLPEDVVYSALEEAKKMAIVEERTSIGGVITYRFTHAFFQQTLYDETISPRRIRLHQRVARAIETVYSNHLDDHASELADHYAHSSDPADLRMAVTYGEKAAAGAISVYAYAEAARLLEQALSVHEIVDPDDKEKRCDLLLRLAEALLGAGQPKKALDTAVPEAFSIAEACTDEGRCSLACQLAILGLLFWANADIKGWGTPEAERWVERSERYGTPDTTAAAWAEIGKGCLNCTKGMFLGQSEAMKMGVDSLYLAMELARRVDDSQLFYWAANMWLTFARAPQHFEERLRLADETADTTFSGLGILGVTSGPMMIADVFLMSGMRDRAENYFREHELAAARTGQPFLILSAMVIESVLATLDGKLEEAVQISDRNRERGVELGMPEFSKVTASLCGVTPRLLLGRTEKAFEVAVAHKAALLAHIAKDVEAGQVLDKWVVGRPGIGSAEDVNGATLDTALLEAAVIVRHERAVELLLNRLSGSAGYAVALNRQTCIGRHLGAAAAFLDRPHDARSYYRQAMEVATKLRFRPEIALIRLQVAELLLKYYPAEKSAALESLNFAIGEFREMKMQPSLERATRLRELAG
jgi:hypothetical protein